ncbi:MAG: hypothetical protein WBW99_10420 [Pseudolabrys sp.]
MNMAGMTERLGLSTVPAVGRPASRNWRKLLTPASGATLPSRVLTGSRVRP